MKRRALYLLIISSLLIIAGFIQVFVSLQVGTSLFIFSLIWLILSLLDTRLTSWISPTILGLTFALTIQAQIHEGIHYLFASIFGAPVDKVVWWFDWQNSELNDPHIRINFAGLSPWKVVVTWIVPFLTLSSVFLLFFYIACKKEPKFTFFTIFPRSLNFAFCSRDLGLSYLVASIMVLIVFFLITFGSFYSYKQRYPKIK